MKLSRDIQSLSSFKRDTSKFMRQLKKTGMPMVLTVNGKAAMVIQDADSFQKEYEELKRLAAKHGTKLTIPNYFDLTSE